MAGLPLAINSGAVDSTTSVKTVLQLTAPTNQRLVVHEVACSFAGTSNTGTPVFVEVLRQTTAGTLGGAVTPTKLDNDMHETIQSSSAHGAASGANSGEPTAGDVLWSEYIHPQTGDTWQSPFGLEFKVPGATRLALRITSAQSQNVVARMLYSE